MKLAVTLLVVLLTLGNGLEENGDLSDVRSCNLLLKCCWDFRVDRQLDKNPARKYKSACREAYRNTPH